MVDAHGGASVALRSPRPVEVFLTDAEGIEVFDQWEWLEDQMIVLNQLRNLPKDHIFLLHDLIMEVEKYSYPIRGGMVARDPEKSGTAPDADGNLWGLSLKRIGIVIPADVLEDRS